MKNNIAFQRGFTLVELMAVVAIMAIIAVIAVPSYKKYVEGARRTEAQTALLELANVVERHRLRTGTYLGIADGNVLGNPNNFARQVPLQGDPKTYDLKVTFTATTYTIFAIPIAGGLQDGNGNLRVSNIGEREWDKLGDGSYSDSW